MHSTRRNRAILWVWTHLPFGGRTRLLIAWLANVRYAVGVAAVITNGAGEVLVLRHTYRRAGHEWGLPGGWVNGRERMEAAVARELREETGFEIVVERLVAVYSGYALPRMTIVFRARIVEGTFRPCDEVSGYAFRRPDDLGAILPAERQAVRQALSADGAGSGYEAERA